MREKIGWKWYSVMDQESVLPKVRMLKFLSDETQNRLPEDNKKIF